MFVLGIETTGAEGSCAVIERETRRIAASRAITGQMSHLKELAPDIDDMLKSLDITPRDLAAVAVSIGPGSFTGIRIGVTTARTLCQALDIPCVPVPTLELFRGLAGPDRASAVILNARRGQVYGAVFDKAGGDVLPPGPYMLTDVLDAAESIKADETKGGPSLVFYGDGIDAYSEKPEYAERLAAFSWADPKERYQRAELVCLKGVEMMEKGMTKAYAEVMPDYMRLAEAEQRLRDGSLRKMQEKKWRSLL